MKTIYYDNDLPNLHYGTHHISIFLSSCVTTVFIHRVLKRSYFETTAIKRMQFRIINTCDEHQKCLIKLFAAYTTTNKHH